VLSFGFFLFFFFCSFPSPILFSLLTSVGRPLTVVARVRRAQRRGGEAETHLAGCCCFGEEKREREGRG